MNIIDWHIKKYKYMEKQDLHKLIYQSQFGNNHLISDVDSVKNYLYEEFNSLDDRFEDLYEHIGNYVRINLRTYKKYNLDINYLLNAFIQTYNTKFNFPNEYDKLLNEYHLIGLNFPLSHSKTYKDNYAPAYRLIHKSFLNDDLIKTQVYNYIDNVNKPVIISIEGKCASGKSTIADFIKNNFKATIIHMDDFFLPIKRKTKARLDEIGGNIDYELVRETLLNIKNKNISRYKVFDCSKQEYYDKEFISSGIIILEGVYSYHKFFRDLIDKLIYIDTDYNIRVERLKARPNFNRYINEWIPLEDRYFDSENILYLSDIIV